MPTVEETFIENRHRVQPNHTNNYETAHGGIVMKWMDEVGAMAAMRFAGETCVTASIDQMNFRRPIPQGDTAFIQAYVFDHGETSIKVRLRAFREQPRSGERTLTTESVFVFVALGDDGKPTEVPELTVDSELDADLQSDALEWVENE
ncbi:acyl-CoA hydrolase [Halohasta litchfieldiae]|jgi:acyl-CoA hydrolase|uniref:Acyl-CoA hydrolase n=1 Tax=Halohasta litchfieldiae TaxID=1073996 RepID=A0A1H6UBV4_9EURY|nr:acyl-CoA thioesterase [Halohasta litchfieldiae]ATW87119.1 acyl-CoA hydrolase [Halohasta litchfieldiae]SEI85332.1 Acyl-CoA hydrolase [Halohasta litchfieldiae]